MLQALRRDGIAITDLQFNSEAVFAHLFNWPVYYAHVQAKATEPPDSLRAALLHHRWPMFCHAMEAAVLAPGLLELAIVLLPLAQDYFEEPPLLYSMNVFWTQPAPNAPLYQDTHSWHRDGDDRKQLVAFFMLTTVTDDLNGSHLYQKGTHLLSDAELGRDPNAPPAEIVTTVYGEAGSVFLEDTRGLHMAYRPRRFYRGLAWARFGVSDPPDSYIWDKLTPVPAAKLGARYPTDPGVRRAIRLVVR